MGPQVLHRLDTHQDLYTMTRGPKQKKTTKFWNMSSSKTRWFFSTRFAQIVSAMSPCIKSSESRCCGDTVVITSCSPPRLPLTRGGGGLPDSRSPNPGTRVLPHGHELFYYSHCDLGSSLSRPALLGGCVAHTVAFHAHHFGRFRRALNGRSSQTGAALFGHLMNVHVGRHQENQWPVLGEILRTCYYYNVPFLAIDWFDKPDGYLTIDESSRETKTSTALTTPVL